jgi:type IV secretory pathway VirD2 relaxase
MGRVAADLGEPELGWLATCHYDTDQPHAHVLIRGRRADGRDLVIPRDYIGYGFRARAQEAAQERLGDLTRAEAERRIWKETEADRFTGFDRRLLAAADHEGLVDDGVGRSDAWAALTRGRLRHLERLGLAAPEGRRYRLATDLEVRLRTLQIRQDVIRTLNQRRLEGARRVQQLDRKVRGRVVSAGSHDELGGAQYVIVRDDQGTEHYARLAFGRMAPKLSAQVELAPGPKGAQLIGLGRPGAERGL